MLQYINQGGRNFYDHPVLPHTRASWEFMLITQGAATLLNKAEPEVFEGPMLWVCSPDSFHGWSGQAHAKECQAMVAHFRDVPFPVKTVCKSGRKSFRVDSEFVESFRRIHGSLSKAYGQPDWISRLTIERDLLDLGMLLLKQERNIPIQSDSNYYQNLVKHAKSLARTYIQRPLSVEEIAESLGISSGHLRRIFHQELQQSPAGVFREIRLDVARQLLLSSSYSITYISSYCGFSSPGAFSRLFKHQYDQTPREFRKENSNLLL